MNVAKFIRTLGYLMYVMLWSPAIVLMLILKPVEVIVNKCRNAAPIVNDMSSIKYSLKETINHDINFIKTGEW